MERIIKYPISEYIAIDFYILLTKLRDSKQRLINSILKKNIDKNAFLEFFDTYEMILDTILCLNIREEEAKEVEKLRSELLKHKNLKITTNDVRYLFYKLTQLLRKLGIASMFRYVLDIEERIKQVW